MKQNRIINSLLVCLAVFFAACSEEVYSPSFSESKNVTLSLSYADLSPREITVNTRATTDAERKLDNLYIYIFDGEGKLKGFKAITSNLVQNTSDVNNVTGDVNDIKTKSGESYIFAVANIETGLYPVSTSNETVEEGKLPIGLDETKAQAGEYSSFTKDKLMSLLFTRNNKNTIQIADVFLMSGSLNSGKAVNISDNTTNPIITDESGNTVNIIKLRRVVSKVNFTVAAKSVTSGDSVTARSFTLSSYDIMNISTKGYLLSSQDANSMSYSSQESEEFSDITNNVVGTQDVKDGKYSFTHYFPENLQNSAKTVSTWADREADDQEDKTTHSFTNAPAYGTYIVLKGKYTETLTNGTSRKADVTYYVHLGDCSVNVNDYNVERNCEYTYKVTVAGVGKIMVEAEKSTQDQPGAEGVVLEFGSAGKSLTLDAHYDYMVMRFYQDDIKTLKANNHGYCYQVKTINGKTGVIEVTADTDGKAQTTGNTNSVDTDWIEFAMSNTIRSGYYSSKSSSTYGSDNDGRGTPCTYPGDINSKDNLYSINDFLALLYSHADDTYQTSWNANNFWTKSGNSYYVDVTCFVKENYYTDKSWDAFTNQDNRTFYVANKVVESNDTRSVYAKVQYGLDQYAIQTFYNRNKASELVAYGCETIDETGADGTKTEKYGDTILGSTSGTETWNGRSNMITDLDLNSYYSNDKYWSSYTTNNNNNNSENNYTKAKYQCLKRNRDLNGDGKITEDEVRWYTPTNNQMAGLWLGEDALSTESRLYTKSTSTLGEYANNDTNNPGRMLYWVATNKLQNFFSEEGMATGSTTSGSYWAEHIKCVRNLMSNDTKDEGYKSTPDTYYTKSSKTISLENVDSKALNITGATGELPAHHEREESNKPASKFTVADSKYPSKSNYGMVDVVTGKNDCSGYKQKDISSWRVPNQRELCLMGVVFGSDEIKQTLCRTIFSNSKFRYSWTNNGTEVTMRYKTQADSYYGKIRCIHVEK